MNAKGVTTISLSPTFFRGRTAPPKYEYSPIMTTSPNINLVCDVAPYNSTNRTAIVSNINAGTYTDCHGSLVFQFGLLQRTTVTERPEMC